MNFVDYKNKITSMFSKYGFVFCPLDGRMLELLYSDDVSIDKAYSIGCDVNAGVSFLRAVVSNHGGEM
jgi:hypothetical protein